MFSWDDMLQRYSVVISCDIVQYAGEDVVWIAAMLDLIGNVWWLLEVVNFQGWLVCYCQIHRFWINVHACAQLSTCIMFLFTCAMFNLCIQCSKRCISCIFPMDLCGPPRPLLMMPCQQDAAADHIACISVHLHDPFTLKKWKDLKNGKQCVMPAHAMLPYQTCHDCWVAPWAYLCALLCPISWLLVRSRNKGLEVFGPAAPAACLINLVHLCTFPSQNIACAFILLALKDLMCAHCTLA